LVGYSGSECCKEVIENPHIHLRLLDPPSVPKIFNFLFIFRAIYKVFVQFFSLLWMLLFTIPKPDFILVQNPPAVPTLMIVKMVCSFRGSKLVIDWHNYGYTILALSLGQRHFAVYLYKWMEKWFGGGAYGNFCVTNAMRQELRDNWGIKARVLYDKPPHFFRETPLPARHNLFERLDKDFRRVCPKDGVHRDHAANNETLFTVKRDNTIQLKDDRPVLLVSSTSWTPDEDFSVLLEALQYYNEKALQMKKEGAKPPSILLVVTEYVSMLTVWLAAEDYPLLLGAADLGISLHTSSSGFDLPMKIVDMFGCGLPVCAINFNCLSELVKHGQNGLIFNDSKELAQQIFSLLKDFPHKTKQLDTMRHNLREFQENRWEDNWATVALPVFTQKLKAR